MRSLFVTAAILAVAGVSTASLAATPLAPANAGAPQKVVRQAPRLEANGHALRGKPWIEQAPLVSLGDEYGFAQIPAPVFVLPQQDNEFFVAQDELQGNVGPKPLRFAVPIAFSMDLTNGEWIKVDGGHVWRTIVV
jgi:hypothetical protein